MPPHFQPSKMLKITTLSQFNKFCREIQPSSRASSKPHINLFILQFLRELSTNARYLKTTLTIASSVNNAHQYTIIKNKGKPKVSLISVLYFLPNPAIKLYPTLLITSDIRKWFPVERIRDHSFITWYALISRGTKC